MIASAVLCILLTAGPQVWVAPSMAQVMDEKSAREADQGKARLFAARGEYEAFQLCVLAGKEGLRELRVEGQELSGKIPAPEVHSVGWLHVSKPSGRGVEAGPNWPDVLLANTPRDLGPGEFGIFWVSYKVPREAAPGKHHGVVEVFAGKKRIERVKVQLRVFDFILPEVPSLSVVLPLDRAAIRGACGVRGNELNAWTPIYDALAPYRVSFTLFGTRDQTREASTEHWSYAVEHASMSCIDVSGVGAASRPGHLDEGYWREMSAWLSEKGWMKRACVSLEIPSERGEWNNAARHFLKVSGAEERLPRLLFGVPHPRFERLADRWAIPFSAFTPELIDRMRAGISMADAVPSVASAAASTCGTLPDAESTASSPEDACDGCLATVWCSSHVPRGNGAEWLRIDYAEPVTAREIVISWAPGMECDDVAVDVSPDGDVFSSRKMSWDHVSGPHGFNGQISRGAFRFDCNFRSIRFSFRHTPGQGPVGVAEIQFGPEETPKIESAGNPIAPWLLLREQAFPSLSADARAPEARMIPWVCWGHRMDGVVGPHLNDWPAAWKAEDSAPALWEGGGSGDDFLVYPSPSGLLPSLRLARLRDGIEDYEYLKALSEAVDSGKVKDKKAARLCARLLFPPKPEARQFEVFVKEVSAARVKMGETLEKLHEK